MICFYVTLSIARHVIYTGARRVIIAIDLIHRAWLSRRCSTPDDDDVWRDAWCALCCVTYSLATPAFDAGAGAGEYGVKRNTAPRTPLTVNSATQVSNDNLYSLEYKNQ